MRGCRMLLACLLISSIIWMAHAGRPYDRCFLPKQTGPCEAIFVRYFYNNVTESCEQFTYGGCGGNENRFQSLEECQSACPASCTKAKVVGPCKAAMPRYFYNTTTGRCQLFTYGGCRGNENNYQSMEACERRCGSRHAGMARQSEPTQPDYCLLPAETGRCKASIPRFYYDPSDRTCLSFIYGGCGGNKNNFDTKEECLKTCAV